MVLEKANLAFEQLMMSLAFFCPRVQDWGSWWHQLTITRLNCTFLKFCGTHHYLFEKSLSGSVGLATSAELDLHASML